MDSPVSPSQLSTYPYLSSRQSAQNTNGIRQHSSSFSVSDVCPMKAVRKRSRLGMEDAFRSMDINHEQPSYEEQTEPPCKRQETLREKSSPSAVYTHFNIDNNNDNFARSNSTTTHENGETKDSVDDINNQHYNRTIAELRLRLPGSSALNPVDAKIEDIIRKSRLQAMIMTGRNNINSSPDEVRIQDDFNVYLGNRTDFDVDMDADPGKSGNNLPSGSMFKSRSYSDFSKVEDSDTSMSF